MKILVLDLETTVQKIAGKTDNSPFNPQNKCVSAHFGWLGWDSVEDVTHLVFYHDDYPHPDDHKSLEDALKECDLAVLQNAKFDFNWLKAMGFTLPRKVYDTMIAEYVLSKGQRRPLSLKVIAERRDVTRKKSDLVDEMFHAGVGFERMPLEIMLEYAEADVRSTAEVYLSQQDDFSKPSHASLVPVIDMMNEMLFFLVDIESNGVQVDQDVLNQVADEFSAEKAVLFKRLNEIVEQVMGDTPINLNSGADLTKVIYSRMVIDRDKHKLAWNIGMQPNGRPMMPPRMNRSQFVNAVRATTKTIKRTVAICCPDCGGRGTIQKYKQITRQRNGKKYRIQGDPYIHPTNCPTCNGAGAIYENTGVTAGLKLNPENSSYASINGFKTDKTTIQSLIIQATDKNNLVAVEFLTKISRLNAVSTYLDTFVEGINNWTRPDGILHTNFNQCITATGRLSSSNINLQNMPKRGFPIRKAMISRFENGTIIEADYSGLELVVCGELSQDQQIIADVKSGKDLHKQTASIINQCSVADVTKEMRQSAKAFSFAPIYGGTGGGQKDHIRRYFTEFFNIYKGLHGYHKKLTDGVLVDGHIQTPSGRQFYWADARRLGNGRITNHTQAVNYPVQSFATADVVPLACIRAYRRFKELKLQSKIVLTVHDSIVVDCCADERDQVLKALRWAMVGVVDEVAERWNYTFLLPLEIEISEGKNWLDQVELD